MIILENPEKPFEYTAKNTPRRSAIIDLYEPEINSTYETFEGTTNGTTVLNGQNTKASAYEETLRFVRDTVNASLSTNVGDDDDIFRAGGGDRYDRVYIQLNLAS